MTNEYLSVRPFLSIDTLCLETGSALEAEGERLRPNLGPAPSRNGTLCSYRCSLMSKRLDYAAPLVNFGLVAHGMGTRLPPSQNPGTPPL